MLSIFTTTKNQAPKVKVIQENHIEIFRGENHLTSRNQKKKKKCHASSATLSQRLQRVKALKSPISGDTF